MSFCFKIKFIPKTFFFFKHIFSNFSLRLYAPLLPFLNLDNDLKIRRNFGYFVIRFNETQNVIGQFQFLITSMANVLDMTVAQDMPISVSITADLINGIRRFVARKRTFEEHSIPEALIKLIDLLALRLTELTTLIGELDEPADGNDDSEAWITIGKCWTLMGTIQFLLFSILDMVDPVLKVWFKISDCKDDVSSLIHVCAFVVDLENNYELGLVSGVIFSIRRTLSYFS